MIGAEHIHFIQKVTPEIIFISMKMILRIKAIKNNPIFTQAKKILSGFQIGSDLIGVNTPHGAERTKKRERMSKMDYIDTIFDWIGDID